ncbi:MAG TPA: cytochrome c biogenesis protein CcdA [Atribacter sp.]|nr:cytochrome c biogenesis protein CcdA [Atribacter sp.]
MDIQINGLVSFLAGLLSFLSPCVLGIAPAYVSYISGLNHLKKNERKFFSTPFFLWLDFLWFLYSWASELLF